MAERRRGKTLTFVLRKKLGQNGTRLVSVRSLGYRFQP